MTTPLSPRRMLMLRLLWAFLALCVLAGCGYALVNTAVQELPLRWRVLILMTGWLLAVVCTIKALPRRNSRSASEKVESVFPSPELSKLLQAQEALQVGFVALDSHARCIQSNAILESMLDLRNASNGVGLVRAFHPESVHEFRNIFKEVCQTANGTASMKLRGFDKIQQLHEMQVTLTRWRESPVAVVASLRDVSELDLCKKELQVIRAALHDLHGVFAGDTKELLDIMRAVLELGKLHFRMEIGLVARLTDENSTSLEVVQVLAPHEDISRGDVFDPTVTHPACPRPLVHAAFVINHHAPPPVYKVTRPDTFLGAPIYCENKLFGLLCFAGPQDRPEGFSSSELELVQFIAQWLSQEVERRRMTKALESNQHQLQEMNSSLETLLRDDLLTGLRNKVALDDALEQETERAREFALDFSVLTLRPDGMSEYRQQHGQSAWQSFMEGVAKVLEAQLRPFDVAARYQESTFVVLLLHSTPEQAQMQVVTLQNEITAISGAPPNLTVSAGIAQFSPHCSHSQQLLQQSLEACDRAQLPVL